MPLILQDPCETIVWLCVSVRAQLIQLFALPWTVAHQAPLSTGFSRPESWSGLPFPSPGDLPDPEIKPGSPTLQAKSLLSESLGKPPVLEGLTN